MITMEYKLELAREINLELQDEINILREKNKLLMSELLKYKIMIMMEN